MSTEPKGCREARIAVASDGYLCVYLFGAKGQRVSVNLHEDGIWTFTVVDGADIEIWGDADGGVLFDAEAMRDAAHAIGIGDTRG